MEAHGVETSIHYPVPPHLSPAYASLGLKRGSFPVTELLADTIFSLPMGPHLDADDIRQVINAVVAAENNCD
jgi:dTDP-3-amino-3,4,6-trideoxy-alpha-D-glucose transaminase